MKALVSILRCEGYRPSMLRSVVEESFARHGGISSVLKKGERVLVKPNLLSAHPPEKGSNTHVEMVRACVRTLKDAGAIPFIGDNPGGSLSAREAYEGSGILAMAREEGVRCMEPGEAKIIKGHPISSYFFDCDKIISMPKMKTHSLMTITGAIKNMFGAVLGLHKSYCHKLHPRPDEFAGVLVNVLGIVRPDFVIMDGVVAMEGNGPAGGDLRGAGLVLASRDSVAIDSVFCHLIGLNPLDVETVRRAAEMGLGRIDINDIEISGEGIDCCRLDGFKLPSSKAVLRMPGPIVRILAGLVHFRPSIKKDMCRRCGICRETCPVSAITIDTRRQHIDYNRCIRCMCCHEVCPYNAIVLKKNFLARMLGL